MGFGSVHAQTLNINYELISYTNTQLVYDVKLTNTSPSSGTMKLAAINNVLTVTMGNIPTSGTTSMFVKDPVFMTLSNVTAGMSTSPTRIRATMTPVPLASTVDLPNGMEVTFGRWTINTSTPMTFPLQLTPTTVGNPTVQAINYFNGATNSNTITLNPTPGGITLSEPNENLSAPLPIKFSDISAFENGKANTIHWTTESEVNNDYQVIERSKSGFGDWKGIGKIASKNSPTGSSYDFNDVKPLGTSYYRIRGVDLDGVESYSDVVHVVRKDAGTSSLGRIYPVPSSGIVHVDMDLVYAEDLKIEVIDQTGKVCKTFQSKVEEGQSTQKVDLSSLASGTYILRIEGNDIYGQHTVIKI
jgi:hypothetical protein